MNKLTILLLLITNFSFSQEIIYHNPNFDLKNGENYYLFGNDVKFRQLPDLTSEVIDLLKIGTEVVILEKTENKLNYNGIESPFYKVKYKNKIGYILGGLISLEKKEIKNSKYFFAYKKTEDNYSIIIRHLNEKSELTENSSILTTYEFSIDLFDNKGIDNVENILFVNYLAEACGIDGGGIFFFKTESELKKILEISQVSDGGVYWLKEKLIFPTDENGIKGKIVYQKEIGNYEDEETNWIEIKITSRELEWKNGDLIPNLETEK
ncbi:SH3 domain-containing protein [Flavivirga aquimarina]|uniref:SH3 domain-containing protein n=1 Tax=Flavivirga aquimarina TaxID=2027862 RepID=A0ABT8WAC2_9FLAO|nr:SH3 domain-containing protein [Flavivirga aquimarina]MDO5970064.1 SH3 domain-containing protein [Flavivirga aquimarina]